MNFPPQRLIRRLLTNVCKVKVTKRKIPRSENEEWIAPVVAFKGLRKGNLDLASNQSLQLEHTGGVVATFGEGYCCSKHFALGAGTRGKKSES